jgi:superfamily I DNA/RNA helicase
MQKEHYKELSSVIGVDIGVDKTNEDNMMESNASNDPYLSIINLARLRKVPLRKQYNKTDTDIDWVTLSYVADALVNYKKRMNLYDFTDMLEIFVNYSSTFCPDLSVSFIDEAQDLSPLQWDVAHIIEQHSEKIYCAGDDDQAIYKWAGADVAHLMGLNGGYEVLEQSYRVPKNVHDIASRIARRINKRVPKTYLPRQEQGAVKRVADITDLDLSEGAWLILAQANYLLYDCVDNLRSRGHLFAYNGTRSISQKISEAVNGWEQMRKGKHITPESFTAICL